MRYTMVVEADGSRSMRRATLFARKHTVGCSMSVWRRVMRWHAWGELTQEKPVPRLNNAFRLAPKVNHRQNPYGIGTLLATCFDVPATR